MATINGSTSLARDYTFYAELTESNVDISSNTSVVNYSIYLQNGRIRTNSGGWLFNAKIDGGDVYNASNQVLNTTDVSPNGGKHLCFSGSQLITHNNDGSKVISFSASLSKSSYTSFDPGTCELAGSFILTSIPRYSTPTINAPNTNRPDFNIGSTITIYTNRKLNTYTHKLYFNYGNTSQLIASDIADSYVFDTSPYTNDLYALTPTSNTYQNTFTLETYNGTTLIGSANCTYRANVINSNPTCDVAYRDINGLTTNVTLDDQKIVQNKSTLQIRISNAAAYNGASLSSVQVLINNETTTQSISSSSLDITIGTINLSNDFTAQITLIDSRGNKVKKELTISVYSYATPTFRATAIRQQNYYSETDLKVDATISSLGGHNEYEMYYRYSKLDSSEWSSYIQIYSGDTNVVNLDNQYVWMIQVYLYDAFEEFSSNLTVPIGMPIFFIDRKLHSLGVNCFPKDEKSIEVNGVNVMQNHIYSVAKRTIGKYTGSVLYQKTFIAKMPTNGSWQTIQTTPALPTGTNIKSITGIFYGADGRAMAIPFSEPGYEVDISVLNGEIQIKNMSTYWVGLDVNITVQYTDE